MEIIEKVWDNIISLKILKDNKHLKGAYCNKLCNAL